MAVQDVLAGILKAIGQGALEKHNVETYGPDYRQKRAESQARLKGSQLEQMLTQHQLGGLEQQDLTEQQAAAQEFPQISDPQQAVRLWRVKRAEEARQRVEESHKADIQYKGAQSSELGQRYHRDSELERQRIQSMIDDRKERGIDRDLMRGLVASSISEHERHNRETEKPDPSKPLDAGTYLQYLKRAKEIADEKTSRPEGATDEEIQAEMTRLLGSYNSARGAPAPDAGGETKVFTTGPCAGKTAKRRPDGKWEC